MSKSVWLKPGDTTQAHRANVAKINAYLAAVQSDGRALPASSSRPFELSYSLVAEEAGVPLWALNRKASRCGALIKNAATGLGVRVRIQPRVRPTYTLQQTISIAGAVMQADCESAGVDHRPKCKMADRALREIARNCPKGLHDDGITAVSAALQQAIDPDVEALLTEIKEILTRATTGELKLQTFHGRLKLESALAGFSLYALAKFISAKPQTVVNWGAGKKAPTRSLLGEIPKIEKVIGCPDGYLSEAHRSNYVGSSNVKRHYMPEDVQNMSIGHQKQFRQLIDPELDISKLSDEQRNRLMDDTVRYFREARDTPDFKRAQLRAPRQRYALKTLPDHVQREFDDLVKCRSDVFVRDDVKSRERGWDQDTQALYHQRIRLFMGWLHRSMGVAAENLSIAYLAFAQVLREYDNFLIDRKHAVGLERRWASAVPEWYVFAASLTWRWLDPDFPELQRESDRGLGWLRGQRNLLSKIKPIELPRVVDQRAVKNGTRDNIRPVLTAGEIEDAGRNWSRLLDDTTVEYRYQRKVLQRETTSAEGTRCVEPILRLADPLSVIETAAWSLRQRIRTLKAGSFHWCTAVRHSVVLKVLAQCPLRRKTFCGLTYADDGTGMVFQEGGWWWLRIPADLFKNEKSREFQKLVVNGYYHQRLEDMWRLYDDLARYVSCARQRLLQSADSPAFYVTRRHQGHVTPNAFGNQFRSFTREYIAENRGRGTGFRGVRAFGPQAMRHIVATATWKKTKDKYAMARAIHDSVTTAEKYYNKFYMGTEDRAEMIRGTAQTGAGPFDWSAFGASLAHPPTETATCGIAARAADSSNGDTVRAPSPPGPASSHLA